VLLVLVNRVYTSDEERVRKCVDKDRFVRRLLIYMTLVYDFGRKWDTLTYANWVEVGGEGREQSLNDPGLVTGTYRKFFQAFDRNEKKVHQAVGRSAARQKRGVSVNTRCTVWRFVRLLNRYSNINRQVIAPLI
jgi:hypothetical protein